MGIKDKQLFILITLLLTFLLVACGDNTSGITDPTTGSPPLPVTTTPTLPSAPVITLPPTTSANADRPGGEVTKPLPDSTGEKSSPYPGKIVFDTADHQIFLTNPDGSGRVKVTEGFSPLFSPDGKRIAYLVRTPGTAMDAQTVINTINLDGSGREELCRTGANADVKLVSWSPRNRFIALSATQQDGPGAIYLCNLSDHTLNRGINTVQGPVTGVYDWTPDGNYALWQAQAGVKGLENNLYFGDPDKGGTGAVALTGGESRVASEVNRFVYFLSARFSPDGNTIAVGGTDLFFLSVPGKKSTLEGRHFNAGQVERLGWSPDGRAMVLLALKSSQRGAIPVVEVEAVEDRATTGSPLVLDQSGGISVDWSRPLPAGTVNSETGGTSPGPVTTAPANLLGQKIDPCSLFTTADAEAELMGIKVVNPPKREETVQGGGDYREAHCLVVAGTSGSDFVDVVVYQAADPPRWEASYTRLWEQELRDQTGTKRPVEVVNDIGEGAFWDGISLYITKHKTIIGVRIHRGGPLDLESTKVFGLKLISQVT